MNDFTARGQHSSPAIDATSSVLTLGFDSVSVRAGLLELVNGCYRLAAWSNTPLQPNLSLDTQAGGLLQHLGDRLHRTLWNGDDGAPFVLSDEPASYPPVDQIAVVASPRGRVRVWLAGLTATQSLAAAEEALGGGPAEIVGQTLHSADLQVGRLAALLARIEIDLIVLVGGYDYPGSEGLQPLYELSRVFAAVLARTPPPQRPQLLFAGNRWAAAGVAEIFQAAGAGTIDVVENVRPAPGVLHAWGPDPSCQLHLLAAVPSQRGRARDKPLGYSTRPHQQHRKQFCPARSGVVGTERFTRPPCPLLWAGVVARM